MSVPVFIAVNQTASDVTLRQLALTVPGNGQVTLSDFNSTHEIVEDTQLRVLITDGYLLLNDGAITLTQAQSLQYMSPIASVGLVNPMTTRGDFIAGGVSPSGIQTRLAGKDGYYIRSQGATGDPQMIRVLDVDGLIADVSIGASLDASAIVQINSTNKGFLLPRMTEAQMLAISNPVAGLMVYVSDRIRIHFYDGTGWRIAQTSVDRVLIVSINGSGDFTNIQDAIDSITDATDINRYVVSVSPDVYNEDITMKDYVQIIGYGWDTLIEGQINCTSISYTQVAHCRIVSENKPALLINANEDGEVNITDCFIESTWDNTANPAEIRCTIKCLQGILYSYKESEYTLNVNDLVNTSSSTIQAVCYVSGSGLIYLEHYGIYHYIYTDNPSNTLCMIYNTNTHTDTQCIFRLGDFEYYGTGIHSNPTKVIYHNGSANISGANSVRIILDFADGNPELICSDIQNSQSNGSTGNMVNCQIIPYGTIADGYIYVGRATTIYDNVQVISLLLDLTTDVQPGRNVVGGSNGVYRYSIINNFGSHWSSGLFNNAEINADVTDWENVSAALDGYAGAANLIFKSTGVGVGVMVPNTQYISNYLTVGKSGDVNYNTIKEAVDYAISQGASSTNSWEIKVYPGTYTESPMSIVPGIIIASHDNRVESVYVVATNISEDLFTCTGGYICGIKASGVTDSSKCLFRCATAYSLVVLHGVGFSNCSNGVICSNGASVICTNNSINLTGPGQSITTCYTVTGSESYMAFSGGFFNVPSALLSYYANNPVQTVFSVNDNASFTIAGATISIAYKTIDADVLYTDGGAICTILACEVRNSGSGIHIGSVGSNTTVVVQSGVWIGNNLNGKSDSSTGIFLISAAADLMGFSATSGTTLSGLIQILSEGYTYIAGNAGYQFTTEKIADFSKFFHDQISAGLSLGGTLTKGTGLNVQVETGSGWITRNISYHDSWNVSWDGYTVSLTSNSTNYIVYDSASDTLISQTSPPSNLQIQLGIAITDGSGIRFLHKSRNVVHDQQYLLHQYLVDTRKIAWKTGLSVSEGSTARKFDISGGSWYRALDTISVDGYTDATFSYFYGSNAATEVINQTELNITQYDNAGTLTTMSDGYFRADTLIVTSDNRLSIVYGTEEFDSSILAQDTANKATMPTIMLDTGCFVALIVIEQAVGIDTIVDIRPNPNAATASSGGGGGTNDHSALTNLDKPGDHTWASLIDGTRAFTGNINIGGNSITNVNLVDGVDVSAHASRHLPGGSDSLTTGIPVAVTVGVSPAEGSATSFARSDHQHGVSVGVNPVSIGTANSEGTSSSVSRADHVHNHGAQTSGTLHAAAIASSTSGFMTGTDKAKLDGIASGATNTPLTNTAPVNVTKAAAVVGVATDVARSDHKHDITTAVVGAQVPGDTVLEGIATSLARSDHRHSLPAFGTSLGTFCQGNDSRLSDDRTASGLRTATTIVSISGASAPTSGQALVAASGTSATWTTIHGDFANGGDLAGANRTLGNTDNYDLAFITNNTPRLTITGGGNVTVAGRLASDTYVRGADFSVQAVAVGQSVVTSYFGLQLVANKQSTVEYTPSNIGSAGDYGVIIPGQQAGTVPLLVRGVVSQTSNLQNWESSAGTALTAITASGNIVFSSTQTVDGRDISVDGSKLDGIASGATNTPLSSTAPVNVTKAAAVVGVGTTAARSDHKHDITTAAVVSVGTANAEGSSTSLARADHIHAGLNRGANDFSLFTEKVSPVSADILLIEDSAAAGVKKKIQIVNLPSSTPIFGSYFQQWQNAVSATNSTTTWVDHINQTTATLAAGTYRIGWYAEARFSSLSYDLEMQVLLDSVARGQYKVEPKDTGSQQRVPFSGFAYIILPEATHTVQFQFRSSNAGNTAEIWVSRIEIWRVS